MRVIGHSQPCYVIAEAGVNHNGDVRQALALAEAAKAAGADCIKFRAFRSELIASEFAPRAPHHGLGEGGQLLWLQQMELKPDEFRALKKRCDELGIEFSASVFDTHSLALMVELGARILKLASAEITNRPLIEACAQTGLPVIASTGASTIAEITRALSWHRLSFRAGRVRAGAPNVEFEGGGSIGLLHCVSAYPMAANQANLRAIGRLRASTHVPVGYSDHAYGSELVPLAVAAGACVIQKGIALSHRSALDEPSLLPAEFAEMVMRVRQVEAVLGNGRKQPVASEEAVLRHARRSVIAARAIAKGQAIGEEDLAIMRPGPITDGVMPHDLPRVVGRRALRDIAQGEPLIWPDLESKSDEEPSWFGATPPKDKPAD